MSSIATIWAAKQKPQRPADKLVLWAMVDAAREELLCFLSVAAITEFTGLDRKTIMASQARLKASGLIIDTGERRGSTRQITVWRIAVGSPEESVPKTAPLETVPETEQSRKRNSPVSPSQQSQKRDTEPVLEPASEPYGSSEVESAEAHAGDEGKGLPEKPSVDLQALVEQWNAMAKRVGLDVAKKLTDERRKRLRARVAEYGADAFTEAIAAVERSSFCRGASQSGWRANIDFVLQASSYTKLLEGYYDRSTSGNSGQNDRGLTNPVARAVGRRMAKRAASASAEPSFRLVASDR